MTTYNYRNLKSVSPEYYDDADEPCRLSWFIVKKDIDEATTQINQQEYTIVHAMDIIKPTYVNIFLNNHVQYNTRREKLTGRVIAAADSIEVIKANLEALERAEQTTTINQYCLVQYCPTPQRLVHRIMQESELIEFQTSNSNYKEIFVRDGRKLYRGYMLMRDESKSKLQNELASLKEKCSDVIRSGDKTILNVDEDARLEPTANTWLLLQYSENHGDSIYSIMRYDSTYMLKGNLYPGLQAYFGTGNITYQAFILQKSNDEADLVDALKNITNSCCMPTAQF